MYKEWFSCGEVVYVRDVVYLVVIGLSDLFNCDSNGFKCFFVSLFGLCFDDFLVSFKKVLFKGMIG